MEPWVRVCTTWEEEAKADREFWLRFSPEERVALIDTMRAEWAALTNTMRPNGDHASFLAACTAVGARVLVLGPHALAFYTKPHYTGALDVFVEPSAENVSRVVAAIEAALHRTVANLSWPMQLGNEPNRINIFAAVEGLTIEHAWSSRVTARYAGATVSFIGRAAFLRHCDAAGCIADAELLRRFL